MEKNFTYFVLNSYMSAGQDLIMSTRHVVLRGMILCMIVYYSLDLEFITPCRRRCAPCTNELHGR